MIRLTDHEAARSELAGYDAWISARDAIESASWHRRLGSSRRHDVEGAVVEARAWDFLRTRVDEIHAFGRADGNRTPDFRCITDGIEFAVEVACLTRARVTHHTTLIDIPPLGSHFQSYLPLDKALKRELSSKTAQGSGLQVPYVVLIGTLHCTASGLLVDRAHIAHFMHSREQIRTRIDFETGTTGETRRVVDFRTTPFTDSLTLNPARRNVSALVLAGFGVVDVRALGMLHPQPCREFDPRGIRTVPFCRFDQWPPPNDRVRVEWTDGPAG